MMASPANPALAGKIQRSKDIISPHIARVSFSGVAAAEVSNHERHFGKYYLNTFRRRIASASRSAGLVKAIRR